MSEPVAVQAARAAGTDYLVLDEDDRIVYVSPSLRRELGTWVGHVVWEHLPGARDLYGPCFEEARESGRAAEAVGFYAGRLTCLSAIPAADGLVVHLEHRVELDVTSLGTLMRSLERIEAELDGRGFAPPGRRAPASPQALP
jgi:hypothetical protein